MPLESGFTLANSLITTAEPQVITSHLLVSLRKWKGLSCLHEPRSPSDPQRIELVTIALGGGVILAPLSIFQ